MSADGPRTARKDADFAKSAVTRADGHPARDVIAKALRDSHLLHNGGWVSATAILEALDREGYTVAARASQAPADAQETREGTGGGRDAHSAAAGRTEARDTAKRRILEALERWHEVGADTDGEFAGIMEAVDDYAAIEQLVPITLVPVEVFGTDAYGLSDAVSSWSDCNRARGRIYRRDDDATVPHRETGDVITVYVPESQASWFDKQFGEEGR